MRKLTKLDKIYEDIDQTYGQATEEQMQEVLGNLEKEINGKREALARLQEQGSDKTEGLEKDIESLEKRMQNIEGYAKNKVQIKRIQQYRDSLEQKLLLEINKRDAHQERLKTIIPEFQEVYKKFKDEKYTMELDGNEYNELVERKEALLAEIKSNREGLIIAKKRIIDLNSKIGKCNLAWKTLFVNKDWDEIQRRAASDEKRFTRKVSEKSLVLADGKVDTGKKVRKEKDVTYDSDDVSKKIGENVSQILDGNNLPAKVSRWTKIKNFFKGIPGKLKEVFGKDMDSENEESKKSKGSKPKSESRDQFLEGLRQYADEDYRKQVKREKEQAYVEAHKIKEDKEDIEK